MTKEMPPFPWGDVELIVLVALLATAVVAVAVAITPKGKGNPMTRLHQPTYCLDPLITFAVRAEALTTPEDRGDTLSYLSHQIDLARFQDPEQPMVALLIAAHAYVIRASAPVDK